MDPVRYAQLVEENAPAIKAALPPDSEAARTLAQYESTVNQTGGCRGCRRRKLMRWMAGELAKIQEKPEIDKLIPAV